MYVYKDNIDKHSYKFTVKSTAFTPNYRRENREKYVLSVNGIMQWEEQLRTLSQEFIFSHLPYF